MVKLSMGRDEGHRCPFVTDKGCSIYEDRPEACRLYPVGWAPAWVDGEGET
jgi:Fe-S-cluster containining protein